MWTLSSASWTRFYQAFLLPRWSYLVSTWCAALKLLVDPTANCPMASNTTPLLHLRFRLVPHLRTSWQQRAAQHSTASSPSQQVGPHHWTCGQRAASSPDLQVGPALPDLCTTPSISASPLHLHCRLVPHRRTSSPLVIFQRSHKLFVDPAANTRLHCHTSCTAQGFRWHFCLQDRCSEVSLKIWLYLVQLQHQNAYAEGGPVENGFKVVCNRPPRPHLLPSRNCLSAVLPGPDKHSRPHSSKTTAIFEAFTATYKKFAATWYFKAPITIKNKKHNVWEGIFSFFYFCSPFLD